MNSKKTIDSRILSRIARKKSNVLLREDFIDLDGYGQVWQCIAAVDPEKENRKDIEPKSYRPWLSIN